MNAMGHDFEGAFLAGTVRFRLCHEAAVGYPDSLCERRLCRNKLKAHSCPMASLPGNRIESWSTTQVTE